LRCRYERHKRLRQRHALLRRQRHSLRDWQRSARRRRSCRARGGRPCGAQPVIVDERGCVGRAVRQLRARLARLSGALHAAARPAATKQLRELRRVQHAPRAHGGGGGCWTHPVTNLRPPAPAERFRLPSCNLTKLSRALPARGAFGGFAAAAPAFAAGGAAPLEAARARLVGLPSAAAGASPCAVA
jgi:hypothetical protein